jgi:hypothetical protein
MDDITTTLCSIIVDSVVDPADDEVVDAIVDSVVDPADDLVVDAIVDPVVDSADDLVVDAIFDSVVDAADDEEVDAIVDSVVDTADDEVVEASVLFGASPHLLTFLHLPTPSTDSSCAVLQELKPKKDLLSRFSDVLFTFNAGLLPCFYIIICTFCVACLQCLIVSSVNGVNTAARFFRALLCIKTNFEFLFELLCRTETCL